MWNRPIRLRASEGGLENVRSRKPRTSTIDVSFLSNSVPDPESYEYDTPPKFLSQQLNQEVDVTFTTSFLPDVTPAKTSLGNTSSSGTDTLKDTMLHKSMMVSSPATASHVCTASSDTDTVKNSMLWESIMVSPPSLVAWPHLKEVCEFSLNSPPYRRIIESFSSTIESCLSAQALHDATYIASTVLKIMEDAYIQWVFDNDNTPFHGAFPASFTEECLMNHSSDVPSLILFLADQVKKTDFLSEDEQEEESLSIHTILLQYLACRYWDEAIHPYERRRALQKSMFHLIERAVKYQTMRLHERDFFDHMPQVSDVYCTSVYMQEMPIEPPDPSSGRLFDKIMHKCPLRELIVLRELGYLYSTGVSLHIILSALTYLHEIRDLPLAGLRGLNYVYSLTKKWLPHGVYEGSEEIMLPENVFPGDDPLTDKSNRPVSLWWTHMIQQKTRAFHLTSFALRMPQYARLRVALFWDENEKLFNNYDVSIADQDFDNIFRDVMKETLTEITQRMRDMKAGLSRGATAMVAAHNKFTCGGPFDVSLSSICHRNLTPELKAFWQRVPIDPTWDNFSSLPMKTEELRSILPSSDEVHEMALPYIDVEDWIFVSEVCLMMRDLDCFQGIRMEDEEVDSEREQFLSIMASTSTIRKSSKTFTPIDSGVKCFKFCHLFNNSPRPVTPRSLLRDFR